MRLSRPSRLIVGVVVALMLLGCAPVPQASRTAAPARVAATAAPATGSADGMAAPATGSADGMAAPADGTGTREEYQRDLAAAKVWVEEYWKARLRESGVRFRPIRALTGYTRSGEVSCGRTPLERNNAAYCVAGDFIAFDADWAFEAFRQVGDAFLYYLIGHEYAHAIQIRLGVQAQFTIQQELQADCMAGAYIGDSVREGHLRLQDDDIDELRAGLAAVADDPGQPWFAAGSHGSVTQRTTAFENGYERSLEPCGLT